VTVEEIYNVEEFLKTVQSNIPIKAITTFRNKASSKDAPKYLTEIVYEDPISKRTYAREVNSLKVLRMIK
jgi:hypothetical protein